MSKPAFADHPLTIEEFFLVGAAIEGRAELVNGRIMAMAGGSARHDRISGDIYVALRSRLRGTGCVPSGPNLGIAIGDHTVRYPDVAVCCDPRDFEQSSLDTLVRRYPRVIFEVLSPSTSRDDRLIKLREYQAIESVDTIVLIDSTRSRFDTFERLGPNEWRNVTHMPGAALTLRDPAITIPAEEIFAEE